MKKTSAATESLSKQNFLRLVVNIIVKLGHYLTKQTTIVEIICALHIILFIYTGLNKLMNFESFSFEISRAPFIKNMANYISIVIPTGELLIAIALIIKRTRLLGLYFSFFLMTLFTGYIWIMLKSDYELPCSCGGVLSQMSWNDHLYFNTSFTLLAMVGVILQSKLNSKNIRLKSL